VIVVNGIDKRQQRVETGAQTTRSKTMMTTLHSGLKVMTLSEQTRMQSILHLVNGTTLLTSK